MYYIYHALLDHHTYKIKGKKNIMKKNNITIHNHYYPVIAQMGFSHLNPNYYKCEEIREPKREELLIHTFDKSKTDSIKELSVNQVGIKNQLYSQSIEDLLAKMEGKFSIEIKKIYQAFDNPYAVNYISFNIFPIFQFIAHQVIRTPMFYKLLKKNLEDLMNMDEEEYNQSIFRMVFVKKPTFVDENYVNKIFESMLRYVFP